MISNGEMLLMEKVQQIYRETDKEWLSEVTQLWRYIPYKTMFTYLRGQVFVPSVEKLGEGDPFEGNFPLPMADVNQALQDRCGAQHASVVKWIHDRLCTNAERKQIQINKPHYPAAIYQRQYLAFLRRTRYAWCWFLSGI